MPFARFRKDFKICGTIGELGQKDKLTFSSLIHQINAGKKKNYSDEEIVDAVIRAVSPSIKFRTYLEGRDDHTLATLRKLLRCNFREKDATELYQELCGLTQRANETPQEFVFRALDLRQKVGFASQETGSTLCYNRPLVQSMFLHAISTGL
ncbi:hypothetical protein HOLleu_39281 [Holothuria leucospilota]|uniref:Uncharacterized protein n=1 Tax=Holothuria leucospilota TaxID=206669 RepID=A0A9Q0YFT8_HOLLE|nr:hypothetical protein HOLleu_39281 [Holothuria leucospilota]